MATYVLIHGASDEFYWHWVTPLLEARGHEVVAPKVPIDDDRAGQEECAAEVLAAVGDRTNVIVVGQSLGAFIAPIVAAYLPTELLILVAPMIPAPGETPGAWWSNTGQPEAQRAQDERDGRDPDGTFDVFTTFLHDVPDHRITEIMAHGAPQPSDTVFASPWPLDEWPAVPTKVLLCRNDRLLPADLVRRLATDRLGITADEIDGGHLVAFADPEGLVNRLERYRAEHELSR